MSDELESAYQSYLRRFVSAFGEVDAEAFVKHEGRLIQKLAFDEFTTTYGEYCDIVARYEESKARGDTINDILVRLMRERASKLVLTCPV